MAQGSFWISKVGLLFRPRLDFMKWRAKGGTHPIKSVVLQLPPSTRNLLSGKCGKLQTGMLRFFMYFDICANPWDFQRPLYHGL